MFDSCNSVDCSLPGSSIYGILQVRILEWVAISFFRGSSRHRVKPMSPALAGGFFTTEPPGKLHSGRDCFNKTNIIDSFFFYPSPGADGRFIQGHDKLRISYWHFLFPRRQSKWQGGKSSGLDSEAGGVLETADWDEARVPQHWGFGHLLHQVPTHFWLTLNCFPHSGCSKLSSAILKLLLPLLAWSLFSVGNLHHCLLSSSSTACCTTLGGVVHVGGWGYAAGWPWHPRCSVQSMWSVSSRTQFFSLSLVHRLLPPTQKEQIPP